MGENLPASRRDSFRVDRDDDALAAEFFRAVVDNSPIRDGSRIDRYVVGAGKQELTDVFDAAHAAADRQRHEASFRRSPHHIENGSALLVTGGDIKKTKLIGAGRVIRDRALDGIAGVAKVDEVDALDDASVLHVETWDDARRKHGPASWRLPGPRPT